MAAFMVLHCHPLPVPARRAPPRRGRWASRAALWLLPLAAGAWLHHEVGDARARVRLAQGIERLAAGDASAAQAHFEALAAARRHVAQAQAGLRLARALEGRAESAAPAAGAAGPGRWGGVGVAQADAAAPLDVLGLSLVGLLDRALRAGQLDVCHELARLAYDARRPSGWLYLAAARLERGDDAGARALAESAAPLFAGTALGRALIEALDWRAWGAVTLVRDRRGVLIGALDGEARFVARDESAAACVPDAALAALARLGRPAGVRLSVDLALCSLAHDALGARRGTIVLLDPVTGAVRAAVSDARTRRREPQAAFTQWREPASVAKLVTTTAALRAGIDPDAYLRGRDCHGSQRYGDGVLWCPSRAAPLQGLAHALAISCNLGFADLAQDLGRPALLDEYRRYGFALGEAQPEAGPQAAAGDDSLASEAPAGAGDTGAGGEAPVPVDEDAVPVAPDAEARVRVTEGGARQLADLAIGLQDVGVTPLYGARFAAVFAHGALPPVVLIDAGDGVLGRSPRALRAPAPRPVLDPAWLPRLWPAMQAVAEWGTAAGVAPPDFAVAMKTGTASEWRAGYHCNHVGVAPLPAPAVAFSVRVTHQPHSSSAGQAAREVTARLLQGLHELHRFGAL